MVPVDSLVLLVLGFWTTTETLLVLYPNHLGCQMINVIYFFCCMVEQLGHDFIYDYSSALGNTCIQWKITHKFFSSMFCAGAGLLELHNDVQTCGYEDVQVMWEILRRSESELMASLPKRKQRPFWRVFVWSNHSAASSFSANHS